MSQNSDTILKKQFARGFLPQAYLFWGDDQDSKENAVQYTLQHLLGENFKSHPNFCEIAPQENDSGNMIISAEAIRLMRSRVFEKPFDTQDDGAVARNVFLIRDIELVSYEATPFLLKILEEPPSNVFFLATTSNRRKLLPTILSRFLMLRFWCDHSAEDLKLAGSVRKLSYSDRFKKIPDIVETDKIPLFVREALAMTHIELRKQISKNSDISSSLDSLSRILDAHRAIINPTISKRLLGEYCAMLL